MFFDLDGTLVDSEVLTDQGVRDHLEAHGLAPRLAPKPSSFHGETWAHIGARLAESFPVLDGPATAATLREVFDKEAAAAPPRKIPGAEAALQAALQGFKTAIVTSNNRATLEHTLAHFELDRDALWTVCAEDVLRSKPAPECYLRAAALVEVAPSRCLVFEDSVAGLTAARAAGMTSIAIARARDESDCRPLKDLATRVIRDFTELSADFFTSGHLNAAVGARADGGGTSAERGNRGT